MKEISTLQIGFDFDLSRLKDLPGELDKILKDIESSLSSLSEKISKSTIEKVPDIQARLGVILQALDKAFRSIKSILAFIGAIFTSIKLDEIIDKELDKVAPEIERLAKLLDLAKNAEKEINSNLEQISRFLADPNRTDKDVLLIQKEVLEERIKLLTDFINKLEQLKDELQFGAFKTGIPEQPEPLNVPIVPRIPVPLGNFGPEPFDRIKSLEEELQKILEEGNKIIEERSQILEVLKNATASTSSTISDAVNPLQAHKDVLEASKNTSVDLVNKGLDPLTEKTAELTNNFEGVETQVENAEKTLSNFTETTGEATSEAQEFVENGLKSVTENAEQVENALSDIDLSKLLETFSPEEIANLFNIPVEQIKEQTDQLGEGFEESTEQAKNSLDSLEVFAADVAANINDSFADLIFNSLKGNFDSLGDLWRSTLDSMLETLSQFLATVISNPIRLSLESFLTGGSGGRGLFSDLTGLGGSLGLGSSGLFGPSGSFTALGALFTGNSSVGFGTTLLGAIPAIGAIAGAIAVAIPIISNLFEKSPRLDIDIGVIKDDIGKRAATVEEFLDPALLDDVINISVKRKAGLGLGGDDPIKEAISDVITASIENIQSIINQLPADLAAQLNETLLNADIDIESKIKGDKLLEFDETKKIAEKFQEFLENDLPARFFAAIRESFFDPALQSLGVTAEASQGLIDQFLEDLQGVNREQRGVIGQDFIKVFQIVEETEYRIAA